MNVHLRLARALRWAALGAAAGAAWAADNLAAPPYPSGANEKTFEVSVVVRATADAAGKLGAGEVLHAEGPQSFAAAALAAAAQSTVDAGRGVVTLWYLFRLVQATEVRDISPDRLKYAAEPALLEYVAPTFPPGAPSLSTEIKLNLLLGPDGAVWAAAPADGGVNQLYAERAVAAALQFKFQPATGPDGKPTAGWYPFVIDFQ